MGIIQCSIHGKKGATAVCYHIRWAVLQKTPIHCNAVTGDKLLGRFYLCDPCLKEWQTLKSEDETEKFLDKIQVVCGACLEKINAGS
jgi:hypothetical protein